MALQCRTWTAHPSWSIGFWQSLLAVAFLILHFNELNLHLFFDTRNVRAHFTWDLKRVLLDSMLVQSLLFYLKSTECHTIRNLQDSWSKYLQDSFSRAALVLQRTHAEDMEGWPRRMGECSRMLSGALSMASKVLSIGCMPDYKHAPFSWHSWLGGQTSGNWNIFPSVIGTHSLECGVLLRTELGPRDVVWRLITRRSVLNDGTALDKFAFLFQKVLHFDAWGVASQNCWSCFRVAFFDVAFQSCWSNVEIQRHLPIETQTHLHIAFPFSIPFQFNAILARKLECPTPMRLFRRHPSKSWRCRLLANEIRT